MSAPDEAPVTSAGESAGSPKRASVDPRLRVLFLLIVAVGVFVLASPVTVGCTCLALAAMWILVKLPARRLVSQIRKLWLFAVLMLFAYSIFPSPTGADRWVRVTVLWTTIRINEGGLWVGVLMLLRVLAMILASQIARAGDIRAISAGLKRFRVPDTLSIAIDTVMALFSELEPRRGRDRAASSEPRPDRPRPGLFAILRRMAKGDIAPIMERLERHIDRAERHIEASTPHRGAHARDMAVIAGVALTILGIDLIKLLPNIPVAPGHKLLLTTPLYVVAAMLTRTRFGATLTGATLGIVAFLVGEGHRFGIFEILNHIAPGIITDLTLPLLVGATRIAHPFAWSLFGGAIAAGRLATTLIIMLILRAPAAAYAMLIPGLSTRIVFGIASGYVTYRVARAVKFARDARSKVSASIETQGNGTP